jgi:hypothetical protein
VFNLYLQQTNFKDVLGYIIIKDKSGFVKGPETRLAKHEE